MKTTKLFSLVGTALVGLSVPAWAGPHGAGGGFAGGGHFAGSHFGGSSGAFAQRQLSLAAACILAVTKGSVD
ncbi:MAG: hypothetical protein DME94_03925 [Verrucomicrobia bacterium]|nr:MAG: hypothetical protein DME94_03925 [Verrucomicrobiota bacterium]